MQALNMIQWDKQNTHSTLPFMQNQQWWGNLIIFFFVCIITLTQSLRVENGKFIFRLAKRLSKFSPSAPNIFPYVGRRYKYIFCGRGRAAGAALPRSSGKDIFPEFYFIDHFSQGIINLILSTSLCPEITRYERHSCFSDVLIVSRFEMSMRTNNKSHR